MCLGLCRVFSWVYRRKPNRFLGYLPPYVNPVSVHFVPCFNHGCCRVFAGDSLIVIIISLSGSLLLTVAAVNFKSPLATTTSSVMGQECRSQELAIF